LIRSFDPETGDEQEAISLKAGAASNPVIVDGTLYVVTTKGQLTAFR
jgi:outer membrane protein assembly factor BamB